MNDSDALNAAVNALPPAELIELQGAAALLSRRERKYLVPLSIATALATEINGGARALQINNSRSFKYASVYFDTPSETSFFTAAHRRRHAFKVRTRTYIDSNNCVLEVKRRGTRNTTAKSQLEYSVTLGSELSHEALDFVSQTLGSDVRESMLRPTITTYYDRSTFLMPSDARLTIDTNFLATTPAGQQLTLDGIAIIETKSRSAPTSADRALWRMGFRPVRLSKFGTSLVAMDPSRPSNRWTRALKSPWQSTAPEGVQA